MASEVPWTLTEQGKSVSFTETSKVRLRRVFNMKITTMIKLWFASDTLGASRAGPPTLCRSHLRARVCAHEHHPRQRDQKSHLVPSA